MKCFNYLFLKNYVTSEGAISHNVLYYQQLSIARYKVSLYAIANSFQCLLIFQKEWKISPICLFKIVSPLDRIKFRHRGQVVRLQDLQSQGCGFESPS